MRLDPQPCRQLPLLLSQLAAATDGAVPAPGGLDPLCSSTSHQCSLSELLLSIHGSYHRLQAACGLVLLSALPPFKHFVFPLSSTAVPTPICLDGPCFAPATAFRFSQHAAGQVAQATTLDLTNGAMFARAQQ